MILVTQLLTLVHAKREMRFTAVKYGGLVLAEQFR